MKHHTKKQNGKRVYRKKSQKHRTTQKQRGGKINETFFRGFQTPHSGKWPIIHLYSKITGSMKDIASKFINENIHKIEYGLHSILFYENIFYLGLQRDFFRKLVYLGQQYPTELDLNPKEDNVIEEEKTIRDEIHKDPNYSKELQIWIDFYTKYITKPNDGTTDITSPGDLISKLKYDNLDENAKTLLDIARLARISWYKNNKINRQDTVPLFSNDTAEIKLLANTK